MKLILAKIGNDCIVGEYRGRSSVAVPDSPLENPMRLENVEMMQGSALDPRQMQKVAGVRVVPLPCSEISCVHVDYFGEVRKTDMVHTLYYKSLEAVKKQAEDPLMVAQ